MTTEARPRRHTRRELIASWQRGYGRATWLGMAPLQILDMEGGDTDEDIERKLWALAGWVRRVEATEWGDLWSEAQSRGVDALALAAEDDLDARIAELKAALGMG